MKKCSLILIIFLIYFTSAQAKEPTFSDTSRSVLSLKSMSFTISDSWFSRDKAHHFLTSAFLASAGYYYSREISGNSDIHARTVGVSFSLSLGLFKEIRDGMQQKNSFSWKDLVADCLGTGLGILLMKE
jgi:uncharacterized protein YfiM (DUF2279 family)